MTGKAKGVSLAMLTVIAATALLTGQARPALVDGVAPGSLIASGKDGIVLPLKSTDVSADISGFGARVTVVQTFTNPSTAPIEAVYTFPLPADAAVDRMRMKVGDRVIDGVIKRREEARLIYDAAKTSGQAAALLDQERPNIFTQSVANIMPKAEVKIEISYVQLLKYESGQFEFSFPMVVGPRFLGNAPDPGKIAPPIVPQGMRTGANISLKVNLDAGAPIQECKSVLHEIAMSRVDSDGIARVSPASHYVISLKRKDEIPNKDFILRYRTSTDTVQNAFLAKYDPLKGGFFSLILMPPQSPRRDQIAPKEVIFVIDQSGSQRGFPIEKSKELSKKLIETMHSRDTFNVLGFSNSVNRLWPEAKPNTAANRSEAIAFLNRLDANGGTQLRLAVEAALAPAPDPKRVRLVLFNTDGFVGDEKMILQSIREHRGNSRMFTFGIGNSVNHYLIDAMSEEGRGDSETVTLAESADAAVARFIKRTENPVLTNVTAKFDGVDVSDQLPAQIPDVFDGKPIVIYGRYAAPGMGKLMLSGTLGTEPWSQTIDLVFPSDREGGTAIPTLWARQMVEKLDRDCGLGMLEGVSPMEGPNRITDLALEFGIMTEYTSFVAIEQRVINIGGKQRTVHVPVEMADGVSYDGIFGDKADGTRGFGISVNGRPSAAAKSGATYGLGGGGFAAGGAAGGPPGSSNQVRRKIFVRHADPEFIAGLANATPEQRFEAKVDAKLRKATGKLEVQIWLSEIDDELIKKLEKAGVTVDVQDKKLKIVFGRCDASTLKALADLEQVQRIEPIS
jgi:Ca-activated chloride channel family protein